MPKTVFDGPVDDRLVDRALEGSRPGSFWIERTPGDRRPALTADLACDLLVIGGGYTGLWTALAAKRRDPAARVVVLEARTNGWAASGRNGGFAEASLTHGESNGRTRFTTGYDALDADGLENLDAMEADVLGFERNADWERTGVYGVATEPHQVPWMADDVDGERAVFLDGPAMRAAVASPTYLAGVLRPRDSAIVDPARLVDALAHACASAGVELFERSPVLGIERVTGGVGATTARATVTARRVALATNAFPTLLKRLRLFTVPVYDSVLMTEPLSAADRSAIGWQGRQGIADSANQFHYYRLTDDDRILFGGYDAIYHYGGRVRPEYEERPQSFRTLAQHFFTTFPQLEDVRFSHRWAGAIDTCSRFCAFFGTAWGGRVTYALGFTGLGVAATHYAADVMLDLLDGLQTRRTTNPMVRSTPLPFPPEPLTWPAVQATRFALNRADHDEGRRGLFLKTLDAVGLGFDS
ncbi:NAD(P)/FAD-dependent oxidoreductase [uncultured Amnibacterium sp.]|uniref:NAD(P)/FAD-dependent oxidoreductase n=1 Tax=uncultured Amnibacterium sp. TaxID=1631851 RepID=UPI0035CA44AE